MLEEEALRDDGVGVLKASGIFDCDVLDDGLAGTAGRGVSCELRF